MSERSRLPRRAMRRGAFQPAGPRGPCWVGPSSRYAAPDVPWPAARRVRPLASARSAPPPPTPPRRCPPRCPEPTAPATVDMSTGRRRCYRRRRRCPAARRAAPSGHCRSRSEWRSCHRRRRRRHRASHRGAFHRGWRVPPPPVHPRWLRCVSHGGRKQLGNGSFDDAADSFIMTQPSPSLPTTSMEPPKRGVSFVREAVGNAARAAQRG